MDKYLSNNTITIKTYLLFVVWLLLPKDSNQNHFNGNLAKELNGMDGISIESEIWNDV